MSTLHVPTTPNGVEDEPLLVV
ncbi:MAG: hypothetical protein K0S99_2773, partial [Thermomicrobiales bacterium]|nr:hypothetical protein [Thermomicrobiales bacterium]